MLNNGLVKALEIHIESRKKKCLSEIFSSTASAGTAVLLFLVQQYTTFLKASSVDHSASAVYSKQLPIHKLLL